MKELFQPLVKNISGYFLIENIIMYNKKKGYD